MYVHISYLTVCIIPNYVCRRNKKKIEKINFFQYKFYLLLLLICKINQKVETDIYFYQRFFSK